MDLDPVSQVIGGLQATMEEGIRQRVKMISKVSEISEAVSVQAREITELRAQVTTLTATVSDLSNMVKEHERMRQRGVGIYLMGCVFSSVLGAIGTKLAAKLFYQG